MEYLVEIEWDFHSEYDWNFHGMENSLWNFAQKIENYKITRKLHIEDQ